MCFVGGIVYVKNRVYLGCTYMRLDDCAVVTIYTGGAAPPPTTTRSVTWMLNSYVCVCVCVFSPKPCTLMKILVIKKKEWK